MRHAGAHDVAVLVAERGPERRSISEPEQRADRGTDRGAFSIAFDRPNAVTQCWAQRIADIWPKRWTIVIADRDTNRVAHRCNVY